MDSAFNLLVPPTPITNKSESMEALDKLMEESSGSPTNLLLPQSAKSSAIQHSQQGWNGISKSKSELALDSLVEEFWASTSPSLAPQLATTVIHGIERVEQPQQPQVRAMNVRESEFEMQNLLVEELLLPQTPTSSIDNMVETEKRPQPSIDVSVLRAKLDMACAEAAAVFGMEGSNPLAEDQYQSDENSGIIEDLGDTKRARRLETNRTAARSYRKRKQEEMNQLETKIQAMLIDQLRDEHASTLLEFADMKKKYDGAAAQNEKLKAEILTLKAKVIDQLIRLRQNLHIQYANRPANVTAAKQNQFFHQWQSINVNAPSGSSRHSGNGQSMDCRPFLQGYVFTSTGVLPACDSRPSFFM